MSKYLLRILFSVLTLSNVALFSAKAQADSSWKPLQIIDMTTLSDLSDDVLVSTGSFGGIDAISLNEPTIALARDGIDIDLNKPKKGGWAGLVEVELKEEPTLPYNVLSTYSDAFTQTDNEARLLGFYTMRYQFNSGARFRPYAGAGLGLVATTTNSDAAGVIAGRATAGFDLTLGEDSTLFAEYAIMKNGGVDLGDTSVIEDTSSGPLDIEHTVKLGFRKKF